MKKMKRILALFLVLAMTAGLLPLSASAADESGFAPRVTWRKTAGAKLPPSVTSKIPERSEPESPWRDDEIVRVSVVMARPSAMDAGYLAQDAAENVRAMRYRELLRGEQDEVAEMISERLLGGAAVDVAYNLTFITNVLSVNVEYGMLDEIRALPGVADAFVERTYTLRAFDASGDSVHPMTAYSSGMIGADYAWNTLGCTGAGTVIAIVDTGIDTTHQSFDEGAFEYALSTLDEVPELFTLEDLERVWDQLNVSKFIDSPEDAYISSKLPFGANYSDRDLRVTHWDDEQSAHGSHVAGIAAANRFIPDGKGGYVDALGAVEAQGMAPDAQLLTMKVFGKSGVSDADIAGAVEDALILGADVVNLSLG